MDPSPFMDRDLDGDAEEFIVGWAQELPPGRPLRLVIHLATPPSDERAAETGDAVRRYFDERAAIKRRELRQLMRRGRTSLMIGLLFLGACVITVNLLGTFGGSALSGVFEEGFIIAGWVAMWRPLEIYLYDWWPLRADWRVLQHLGRMEVELDYPQDPGPR